MLIEGDSGVRPITKRIYKNRKYLNSASRNQSEDSTNSSPFYNKISPQLNLKNRFDAAPNNFQNNSLSSHVIYSLAENGTLQEYAKEQLEEDVGDSDFRRDFPQLLKPYKMVEEESKLRENLICKIKKVWDEFKLSDDTFFRAVFLYDYQNRVKPSINQVRHTTMVSWIDEIFSFADSDENKERQMQYMWFFEFITCLLVAMK